MPGALEKGEFKGLPADIPAVKVLAFSNGLEPLIVPEMKGYTIKFLALDTPFVTNQFTFAPGLTASC